MGAYESFAAKRYKSKVDAKGDMVLIKFHNEAWHCVGPFRKSTFHPSLASARAHVEFTWQNFILKTIDHNGVMANEDFRLEPEPVQVKERIAREIWCPPPLPPEPVEPSEPAWLPPGVMR